MQCNIVFWVLLSEFTCRDDSVTRAIPIVLHLPLFTRIFFRFALLYRLSTESLELFCGWPSKTECPVLSAIVSQHRNTNGQQLKAINPLEVDPLLCLTSGSLIIVSKHKPINSCRRLHPTTTKTLASYPKPSVFEVIQASSTEAWITSPPENRGDGFLNGVVEKRDYLFWTQEYNFWKITTRQLKLWSF